MTRTIRLEKSTLSVHACTIHNEMSMPTLTCADDELCTDSCSLGTETSTPYSCISFHSPAIPMATDSSSASEGVVGCVTFQIFPLGLFNVEISDARCNMIGLTDRPSAETLLRAGTYDVRERRIHSAELENIAYLVSKK